VAIEYLLPPDYSWLHPFPPTGWRAKASPWPLGSLEVTDPQTTTTC